MWFEQSLSYSDYNNSNNMEIAKMQNNGSSF